MKTLGRDLGLRGVIAISVGAMIGGGLFVLPGLAAAKTGPSLWLAFLIAGVLVLPAALSKAEMATALPGSGGTYLYIERSLGPLAGTVAGVGAALSLLFKACFALMGLGGYLLFLVPVADAHAETALKVVSLILLAGVGALNLAGVRRAGRLQMLLVAVSLLLLVTLAAAGAFSLRLRQLSPQFPFGASGLLAASAFIFVSYAGVTNIAAIAEEVKDSHRNVPLGILLSLGGMATLYALVSLVLVGVVPHEQLFHDITPIATLARHLAGDVASATVSVVAVLALVSMANAGLLTSSRFPFAMSRDGLLPPFLHVIHPTLHTPVMAIVLTMTLMVVTLLFVDVERVAKLASGFQIFIFSVENFALIVFRESGPGWYRPRFRAPLYPGLQILGILGGGVLLTQLGGAAIAALAGFSGLAALGYLGYGRKAGHRRGLLQQILTARTPEVEAPLWPQETELPEAGVVVALFGMEGSPESLVEMAASLREAPDNRIDVLLFREAPAHTVLADVPGEDDRMASFRRRTEAMAQQLGAPVFFETIVTHDMRRALYQETLAASCKWVVLQHRLRRYAVLVTRPLERLLVHLPCNVALYKDAGIRVFRRILVLAEPGPHDAQVVRTADAFARLCGGELTFVEVLADSAAVDQLQAVVDYHDQVRSLCASPTSSEVLRSSDRVGALVHATAAYDLLILAAGAEKPLRHLFVQSPNDRITSRAVCSVLQLRTPRAETHPELVPPAGEAVEVDLTRRLAGTALQARRALASKQELFGALAGAFAGEVQQSARQIEEAFWAREAMQNTAIGHGLAIPHATLAGIERTLLGVITLKEPVDYASQTGRSVDVCLATVGPPGQRQIHLRVLGRISSLILRTALLEDLRRARDAEELSAALERAQSNLDRQETAGC